MNEQDDSLDRLLDCERRRCAALQAGDIDTVLALVDPRLRHVHTSGRVDDATSYERFLRSGVRFLQLEREGIKLLRVTAHQVLMAGLQHMHVVHGERDVALSCEVSQWWHRPGAADAASEDWKLLMFHATALPERFGGATAL